jgi:hypothetical protein
MHRLGGVLRAGQPNPTGVVRDGNTTILRSMLSVADYGIPHQEPQMPFLCKKSLLIDSSSNQGLSHFRGHYSRIVEISRQAMFLAK